MLGAAVAPAAAKKDHVGNEVADNMCTGETSGHDYDAFDEEECWPAVCVG